MSTTEPIDELAARRPKRADACRNYDRVIATAREAFAERGASTSLEEIARRAGVGIGTLYRHFPNRQALLEAVYVGEVQALSRSASELSDLSPWDAFSVWAHGLAGYMATKQALADELVEYLDPDAPLFMACRTSLMSSAQPLLERAQQAGAVRPDADLWDIIKMVGGIAKIAGAEPAQIDHILSLALDGLRYRPDEA